MLEKINEKLDFDSKDIIERLVKKLGKTEDEVYELLLDVIEIVLGYIHCDKVPEGLERTLYKMIIDYETLETSSSASDRFKSDIKSVQRGDVKTEFQDTSDKKLTESTRSVLIKDYAAILNGFRKMQR